MKQMNDDIMIDESDEYLLRITNQLQEELQDIKVSEELIAKTLERAKVKGKQETNLHDSSLDQMNHRKEDTKVSVLHRKSTRKWITSIAGVAAACFLLMIGSKVFMGGYLDVKNESSGESSAPRLEATTESTAVPQTNETYNTKANDFASQDVTSQDVMAEESATVKKEQAFSSQDTMISDGAAITQQNPVLGVAGETEMKANVTSNKSVIAYEQAMEMGAAKEQIYEYLKSDNEAQSQSLLELFSSEQMKLISEEATDTWDLYVIISMEESSAILYRIGNKEQVVANVFGEDGKSQDVVYRVEDMKLFRESVELILNEGN